jgi:hypothetical protein
LIKLTIDLSGIDDLIDRLEALRDEMPVAIERAVNRAGQATTTQIKRTLSEETGLGVRDLDPYVYGHPIPDGYEIVITDKAVPLSEFGAVQRQRGVSARPWGHRRIFPHTFEVRSQVFKREGPERLPIAMLWGPSPGREAVRGQTLERAKQTAKEVFSKRIADAFARLARSNYRSNGGSDD